MWKMTVLIACHNVDDWPKLETVGALLWGPLRVLWRRNDRSAIS